jgi:transcriptional regulator with XRE-family HTH domain
MTDDAYGATIAKRRLSRRLTELRVATGYTANHVCDILNWGRGKVGRFEANQWKRPEMSDIRDLFRVYDVPAGTQEELEDLAIRARGRPWWRDYPEIFDNEFPGFENDATRIRVFMPLILPGLLQTPAYVEALMRAGSRPPAWREKALATRLRRQEILQRGDATAPALNAVITEASLMYRWGTRADRYEQVVHLTEIGRRQNVELRIQRFIDGPYPGMHSMINIFGYPDGEPSLVYMETDYAIEEVSNAESVNAYVQAFGRASEGALEPADTAVFLRQLAEQLE